MEQARAGEVTELELQSRFPRSRDPALQAAYRAFASMPPFELPRDDIDGITPGTQRLNILERWIVFLRSDREFVWQPRPAAPLSTRGCTVGILIIVVIGVLVLGGLAAEIVGEVFSATTLGVVCIPTLGAATVLVALFSGERAKSRQAWSEWMRAGDPTAYPFATQDDLAQAANSTGPLHLDFACPKCGYDLNGLTQPGCPECGLGRQPA